jgi:RuvB-like protein 2
LFVDVKRSTQFLMEYQNEYMYNELAEDDNDEEDDEDDEEEDKDEEEKKH